VYKCYGGWLANCKAPPSDLAHACLFTGTQLPCCFQNYTSGIASIWGQGQKSRFQYSRSILHRKKGADFQISTPGACIFFIRYFCENFRFFFWRFSIWGRMVWSGVNCVEQNTARTTAKGAHVFWSCKSQIHRVGQNRMYTPYMTVCLVISLPKIPYTNRIYIWFWPSLQIQEASFSVCWALKSLNPNALKHTLSV